MLELINALSTLDDLLIIGGLFLVGYGETTLGIVLALTGVGIMVGKGEILVPVN